MEARGLTFEIDFGLVLRKINARRIIIDNNEKALTKAIDYNNEVNIDRQHTS